MASVIPVILSGGHGTRLWPVSRVSMPKQLIPLTGHQSLLQETVQHVCHHAGYTGPIVIGSHAARFTLRDQIHQVTDTAKLIIEPSSRDTMAAVMFAACLVAADTPEQCVAILPCDHVVTEPIHFHRAIFQACAAVSETGIAVLGMVPDGPKTGYGYICPQDPTADGVTAVKHFHEKPDPITAERLVQDGWLWNAGIFCFRAGWLVNTLAKTHPDALRHAQLAVVHMRQDLGMWLPGEAFEAIEKTSFDYGFMENTSHAVVVRADLQWRDIGDWEALWHVADKDKKGNAVSGKVSLMDSRDNVVRAERRLVCGLGIENLAIIETGDAVLVAPKARAQEIKDLVSHLSANGHDEAQDHMRVHRPWGWYATVDAGHRFKVKHITVTPGASLSLQMHHHRAEHWVVVRGSAEVHVGGSAKRVHENQSIYIPMGSPHRLANPGKIPLELIEVQTGAYLEEDDIIRFDDAFGRITEDA